MPWCIPQTTHAAEWRPHIANAAALVGSMLFYTLDCASANDINSLNSIVHEYKAMLGEITKQVASATPTGASAADASASSLSSSVQAAMSAGSQPADAMAVDPVDVALRPLSCPGDEEQNKLLYTVFGEDYVQCVLATVDPARVLQRSLELYQVLPRTPNHDREHIVAYVPRPHSVYAHPW